MPEPTTGLYDLVVVANRLPVDRREDSDGTASWQPSPGGLVTALGPVMQRNGGAWIGWTGAPGDAPAAFDADGMHLVAVPLSPDEIERYYEGMSNGTLWPLYHDVIVPPRFHRAWWDSYVKVNRRFADAAAACASQGAAVWVQDYQLQLVPRMLREVRPDLRIGFFNHIPFPPYEIFAQLPWRRQVLEGLLGADLLGFQRSADANNFLRACRRIGLPTRRASVLVDAGLGDDVRDVPGNGVRGEPHGVLSRPREVRAQAFPISIDASTLDRLARREDVKARAAQIRHELGDPETVLLGVDRLDYTKGILHRLKAVEELFEDGRLTVPGAVLVQVATPSRERVEQYQQMRDEVEATVGRINGMHGHLGHPAVHYLHQSFGREELAAMYLAADVMLVTALRDGMNLVAKEYVATRYDERGSLVLSEFTGAANELHQAWLINPHDIAGLKDAIVAAVTAPPREITRRMRAMRRRVFAHDVRRWASEFLRSLSEGRPAPTTAPGAALPEGLQRSLEKMAARDRLLVAVDFDGVLAPIVGDPDDARPLPAASAALALLARTEGVQVAIVSGRTLADLRRLASPPPGAVLMGSHGAEVAEPPAEDDPGSWQAPVGAPPLLDEDQSDLLLRVTKELEEISARHRSTHVELKPSGVVLHTRRADRQVAERAAAEAVAGSATWAGVHVTQGKEVVELSVVPTTKGSAMEWLRRRSGLPTGSGGVLYVGDDVTDERAFAVLDDDSGDVSVKVGEGPTIARHRIDGPEDVAGLLEHVAARVAGRIQGRAGSRVTPLRRLDARL